MKTNNSGLDEMQKERRNSIGNQMFMLMFYALFINCGLYGYGIRWLNYPMDIMIILMVCMAIYLVRTIAANAYLPPRTQSRKAVISTFFVIAFSSVLAFAAYRLFGNHIVQSEINNTDDNSALILFIVSACGLLISLIVAIIKKNRDNQDNDD